MKNRFRFFGALAAVLLLSQISCDKVSTPNIIITDLDTNLFPGNFIDYEFPEFEANTNTAKNVLLEDYTGHQCPGCPAAATIAKNLEDAHPGRVFSIGIHAGYQGVTSFQATNGDYPYDFTTPEGLEMAVEFSNLVGLITNPSGMLNRTRNDADNLFLNSGEWSDMTNALLASDLQVNIQAKSNYYPSTRGAFLHVESEILTELAERLNIAVYVVKDKIISPQKVGGERDEDYEHHNIHIDNVYDETWGRGLVDGNTEAGTKVQNDYSYALPSGVEPDEMHFLIFVYNRDTYEVKQVIKHTL